MKTIREQIAALPQPYRAMAERYEKDQRWFDPFPDSNWDKFTDDWYIIGFDRRNSDEGLEFWNSVSDGQLPPIQVEGWIQDEINFTLWQYMGWGGTMKELELDPEELLHQVMNHVHIGCVGFCHREDWLRKAYRKARILDVDLTDTEGRALELYVAIKDGRV